MTRWLEERLHDGFALRLRADTVLCERDTGHQRLTIFETKLLGRTLMLDDIVQTTERDEFVYHEMIVHVPLLAHGAARQVLVIGGGDGGAIEEVLKHRDVEQVRLVELRRGHRGVPRTPALDLRQRLRRPASLADGRQRRRIRERIG